MLAGAFALAALAPGGLIAQEAGGADSSGVDSGEEAADTDGGGEHAASPGPADAGRGTGHDEVLAVIDRLFDGMRANDSAAVRSVFHPEARFAALDDRTDPPRIVYMPIDGFVRAVGTDTREWDERIWDAEVRIDGPLATVWTPYAFYLDGEFSHCGVDSFQLLDGAEGWKVVSVSDTRRTEGCDVPPEVSDR